MEIKSSKYFMICVVMMIMTIVSENDDDGGDDDDDDDDQHNDDDNDEDDEIQGGVYRRDRPLILGPKPRPVGPRGRDTLFAEIIFLRGSPYMRSTLPIWIPQLILSSLFFNSTLKIRLHARVLCFPTPRTSVTRIRINFRNLIIM